MDEEALRTLLVFPEALFPFPFIFSSFSFCFFSLVSFRRCSRIAPLRISSSSSLLPASSSAFRPFLNDAIFACSFARISDILPTRAHWNRRIIVLRHLLLLNRVPLFLIPETRHNILSRSRSSPESSSSSSRFRFLDSFSRFAASACSSRMDLLFAGSS
jgi:hypothetical protein